MRPSPDAMREEIIKRLGLAMLNSSDDTQRRDLWERERCQIKARSPHAIARMEKERGLAPREGRYGC